MSRLGRSHPSYNYHLIKNAVISIILNIGDSDFISSTEIGIPISNPTSSDSFSGNENINLFPKSLEIGTFFDTAPTITHLSSPDIGSFIDSNYTLIVSNDNIFSFESYSIYYSNFSSDFCSSSDSNKLFIELQEFISSQETNNILLFNSDSISSIQTENISNEINSSDQISSQENSSISNQIFGNDFISSLENSYILYNLQSSDTFSSGESNSIYYSFSLFDSASFTDNAIQIQTSSSDSLSFTDSSIEDEFVSFEFGVFSDSNQSTISFIYSNDSAIGIDYSQSTVGSNMTLQWNINKILNYRVFSTSFNENIISAQGKLYSGKG